MSKYGDLSPMSRENRAGWSLGAKWAVAITAVVVLLVVVGGLLGLGLGWFQAGVDVVSPDNVKAQYQSAYTNYESLKATAGTVCSMRHDEAQETNPDVKSQLASQRRAYEQTYRNTAAKYDAAYDNAFQAKHVGPTDIPSKAPNLDAMLQETGCTG